MDERLAASESGSAARIKENPGAGKLVSIVVQPSYRIGGV